MAASLRDHAEFYASIGWPVIPLTHLEEGGACSCGKADCPSPGKHPDGRLVHSGLKEASTDTSVVRAWWDRSPQANIGIRTGVAFDVLDLDGPDGKDWLVGQEAEHGPLEGHLKARSGKGGAHVFFKPTGLGNTTGIEGRKVDWRGVNGYIIVAPSVTVGPYSWETGKSPMPGDIREAPAWVVAKLASRKQRESITGTTGLVPKGQRNSALISMAGSLVNRGIEGEALRQALQDLNRTLLEEPLSATEVDSIFKSATGFEARPEPYRPGDTGNAEWFVDSRGDLVRYDHHRKTWYLFDDTAGTWAKDSDGGIYRLWTSSARQRLEYAASLGEQEDREREAKSALSMEADKRRIEAGITLAGTMRPVATAGKDWNPDPFLLGCANGVVDLRTGELRRGLPKDMVNLSTGLDFDPSAQAPRWEQFLEEVFGGDRDLIRWLQKAVGYSASGMTNEEVFLVCYGIGSNGKSKFLESLKMVLGDYAWTMEMKALESGYQASISNDLAAVRGKRFVTASETNDGTDLNTSKLKMMTGSEEINARALYREAEPFRPNLTLWLAVNHRPGIPDDSNGIWRRIRLVPFEVIFDTSGDPLWTGPRADDRLEEKLKAERQGILRWVVEGAVRWWDEGLKPAPERVMAATTAYRSEQDYLTAFIRDRLDLGASERTRGGDLYEAFCEWWSQEGMDQRERPSGVKFATAIQDRMKVLLASRFRDGRDAQGRWYEGFSIKRTDVEKVLAEMAF